MGLREFGVRIRVIRERLGLSQETLANQIGMARSYLVDVENGRRNIGYLNEDKIIFGLGMTREEFFASPLFSIPESMSLDSSRKPNTITYRYIRVVPCEEEPTEEDIDWESLAAIPTDEQCWGFCDVE